jgi:4-aminobutyrate aminotransferase-like enzyme
MSNAPEIQAKHAKHVLTPWVAQGGLVAPVIVRAEGRYLFDVDGNKFFDLASGLIAVNLGHGHPKVVKAIQEQAATLQYAAPNLFNETRAELAYELSEMSPWLSHVLHHHRRRVQRRRGAPRAFDHGPDEDPHGLPFLSRLDGNIDRVER